MTLLIRFSFAPSSDPSMTISKYKQTPEQLLEMGYSSEPVEEESVTPPEDIYTFNNNCSSCSATCETRMHIVSIPHFKDVVLMSTSCGACGYKSNEVKSGGGISAKGKKIILKLTSADDLNRDVLKSESCLLKIPEIDFEIGTSSMGGRFTTIEGLLRQVIIELNDKVPFLIGDSALADRKTALSAILNNLDSICEAKLIPVTLILDDPLGNSYLQNIFAPEEDPNMIIEEYDRTFEQNEEYGLNDLKTD